MTTSVEDIFANLLSQMTEDQINALTGKDVFDLTKDIFRKMIYQEFPSAEPRVLEALILLYDNISDILFEREGISLSEPISQSSEMPEAVARISEFSSILGKALRKTVKTLN
jgi:hypothetical protein